MKNPKLFETALDPRAVGFYTDITLRDLFAAFALDGLLSTKLSKQELPDVRSGDGLPANYATAAYLLADAMLAEREKEER